MVRSYSAIHAPQRQRAGHLSGTLMAALGLVLLGFSGCGGEKSPVEKKPRPARFAVVGATGVDDAREFSGSIQSRDATPLSFRVGGTLAELPVKMGASVIKGQLIGRLDASDLKVALAQAQANWQSAKTQADTAQAAFRRAEKLYEAGSAPLSDYENARGQVRSARAQQSAASQAVKRAKNQVSYCTLRAPFDGVVESVMVKNGEQVGVAKPVAVVSRGGEIEVSVGVPESLVARIKVGTAATVTVTAAGDRELKGTVREVGFASANSTYPVRVALTERPKTLRPGMAAAAKFDLGKRAAALSIPVTAVGNEEASSFVYVLVPGAKGVHTARKTSVELGELIGTSFEVKAGVVAGDKIATAGLSTLVDGMAVRLMNAGESRGGKGGSVSDDPAVVPAGGQP